jgi:micrococcal nuclease
MKTLILAAVVISVTDGDTLRARIPAWAETPFEVMGLRIVGIDTPESKRPLAKCDAEVRRGLAAKDHAKRLIKDSEAITFTYRGPDKYGQRVLASVTLPNGEDFATVMIAAGHARPYDGKTKGSWCP